MHFRQHGAAQPLPAGDDPQRSRTPRLSRGADHQRGVELASGLPREGPIRIGRVRVGRRELGHLHGERWRMCRWHRSCKINSSRTGWRSSTNGGMTPAGSPRPLETEEGVQQALAPLRDHYERERSQA
jgi:hypothetical protein